MRPFPTEQQATAAPPHRNNILIMSLCTALICLWGYQVFCGTYNFDIWYILATGREIVENGIPYENVFTMLDGLAIVVQQWLLCVIYFAVYELFGLGGISLLVTLAFFATILVLYRIIRIKRRDDFGGEWALLLLLLVMVVLAPQFKMVSTPFSILILSSIVLLLEKYRRDSRWPWLGCIVAVVVLHMQLHMSFIVFDLAIIGCYLIPDVITPLRRKLGAKRPSVVALADADYRRLPLLVLLIACALATLMNPYGIDGSLYLLNSYGAAMYGNVIPELRPLSLFAYGMNGLCALATTLLAAAAIGKAGLRRIDLPSVLIFVGCTWLGFSNMRNLWMLGLPVVLLAAAAMRGWYIPRIAEAARTRDNVAPSGRSAYPKQVILLSSVICAVGVGAFALLVALNFTALDDNATSERYTPKSLLNAIARDAEETDARAKRDDLRIFNPTVLGGYMEWEGFPVYNDSRVEVWNSAISGQPRNLHNEYVDMTLGKWSADRFDQFITENDFDYLIAEANSPLQAYLNASPEFQNILGTQYYELYKKL